jgi:hypothetical protein
MTIGELQSRPMTVAAMPVHALRQSIRAFMHGLPNDDRSLPNDFTGRWSQESRRPRAN